MVLFQMCTFISTDAPPYDQRCRLLKSAPVPSQMVRLCLTPDETASMFSTVPEWILMSFDPENSIQFSFISIIPNYNNSFIGALYA